MNATSGVLAALAGATAFLVVGVATTELVAPWIEFSLFVGIPVGVVAGIAAAVGVYLGLADEAPPERRRLARSVAGFGVVFLAVLVAGVAVFGLGVVVALGLGVGFGIVAAAVSYRRSPSPLRAA